MREVLAPVEPTVELLKAGCMALGKSTARDVLMAAELSGEPHAFGRAKMRLRWAAMLAASSAEPSFETIDRTARAICMAENDDPCGSVYAAIDESARNGYRHMAKAALLAACVHR